MATTVPARGDRQELMAPYERMRQTGVVLVGAGAVGRQAALQLAAVGVGSLTLYDNDTVEEVNCGPQGYRPEQIGLNKAYATAEDCLDLNPDVTVVREEFRFGPADWKALEGKCVFSCADSMLARRNVYEAAARAGAHWFGDARVSGETIRALAAVRPAAGSPYEATLFDDAEAHAGSCHGKMIIYGAAVAAGLLVARFVQHVRGHGQPFADVTFDLFGWDLYESQT